MANRIHVALRAFLVVCLFGWVLIRLSAHPTAPRHGSFTPTGAPIQAPSPFRSRTDLVALYVTVTDASGRLLTGLTKDHFTLLDQGREQSLSVFSAEPHALSLVVMLDYSGSMRQHRRTIGEAAGRLVDRLLPEDRARVGAFPDGSRWVFGNSGILIDPPGFTGSREELAATLLAQAESIKGSGSPVWEAADRSLDALATETSRRVLVLLSDGHDNQSGSRFRRVEKRVREMPAWVYTIGFSLVGNAVPTTVVPRAPSLINAQTLPIEMRAECAKAPESGRADGASIEETMQRALANAGPSLPQNPQPSGAAAGPPAPIQIAPEPRLKELALASGGRYFEASGSSDFAAIFTEVIDELHSQYLLGFVPAILDGRTHTVEVRVRVAGAKAHTRPSYVAGRR